MSGSRPSALVNFPHFSRQTCSERSVDLAIPGLSFITDSLTRRSGRVVGYSEVTLRPNLPGDKLDNCRELRLNGSQAEFYFSSISCARSTL